jgi:uncharacterized membrane protein (UPF0136 family)
MLAALLASLFAMRFSKNRKFMPSGMLTILSMVVLAILFVAAFQAGS